MKFTTWKTAAACWPLLSLGLAGPVRAQSAPNNPASPTVEPLKLERFVVTGSYIPFADTQTALPLATLDAPAIANSGIATNVLEFLRKAAPQFSGNGNLGNSNANVDQGSTGGGSKLALRNTQTLVLVNGRRMTYAPVLAAGGQQFVDVNLIPLAAIARIEVLLDGASATYGTDAVAGVVNIILKTDYRGAEAGLRWAVAPGRGRYQERSASLVGGTSTKRATLSVSAEYARSDPLFQSDRGFSNPAYSTPTFAGVINTSMPGVLPQYYVLNPSLNGPPAGHTELATLVAQGVYLPVNQFNLINGVGAEQQYAFNLANSVTLLLENERRSATLNFEHRTTDRLTLFGDVIATRTGTFSQLNAQPIFSRLPVTNPANPTTQPMQVRNRFVDYPRLFFYDSTSLRTILGARGELPGGLQWEAAANRNAIRQSYTNPNVVDAKRQADAIASGLLNLSVRTPAPGALDAAGIFGTAWGKARSTLSTFDGRVTGRLFRLPAGDLGFAAGADYRVETLTQSADRNSHTATFNWNGGVAINPFDRDRDVWSGFVEVRAPLVGERQRVPLVHALDLSAAIRHERYSDTDDPTVPKLSLAWRPVPGELLLRATLSRSFAAPTLFNLFGPNSFDDAGNRLLTQFGGGQFVLFHRNRSGANPNLLPSRSRNFTAGFVWSPRARRGFSLTVDLFDIEQTDLISPIVELNTVLQDVELKGADSPYARFVKLGAFDGAPITRPGQLSANAIDGVYATSTLTNIAGQRLRGVDVRVEYAKALGALGRVDSMLAVAAYDSYTYQPLPSLPSVETAGRAGVFNGIIPRWRGRATLNWSRGSWRANLGWQHLPGVIDPAGDGTPRKPFAIRSHDAADAAVAYEFAAGSRRWISGLTLRLGADNVFDAMPPFAGGTFSGANADIGTYSPIGRLLYLEARYKF